MLDVGDAVALDAGIGDENLRIVEDGQVIMVRTEPSELGESGAAGDVLVERSGRAGVYDVPCREVLDLVGYGLGQGRVGVVGRRWGLGMGGKG